MQDAFIKEKKDIELKNRDLFRLNGIARQIN